MMSDVEQEKHLRYSVWTVHLNKRTFWN